VVEPIPAIDAVASATLRSPPPHVRLGQILDAAERLIVEHAYEGMTMDQVAAAAGVAKGTIYLYFPSKQNLLVKGDVARRFLDGPSEALQLVLRLFHRIVGATPAEEDR
jgi:AcrR family transcriptional regulator